MLTENEHTPLTDLAALVSLDPALSAIIIKTATSHHNQQNFTDINLEQSLLRLGLPLLRTIASCLAAHNTVIQTVYERNIDYFGYWRHSLRVAAMAKSIATAVGYQQSEEAYYAGLFHDIGQLLLVGGVAECGEAICGSWGNDPGPGGLTQALSGIDHASLGARLIDSWHISSFMAEAILFHQFPFEEIKSADLLIKSVWAAHSLGMCDDDQNSAIDFSTQSSAVSALLCLAPDTIARIYNQAERWVEEHIVFFGLQSRLLTSKTSVHKFIFPYLSLPKQESKDSAQLQLDALIRNQAVIQTLQQRLPAFRDESDIYNSLSEASSILFGLNRPVFFTVAPDRTRLIPVSWTGGPPLLRRLEIPLNGCNNLPSRALQKMQPESSYNDEGEVALSLIDTQLTRQLDSKGLLCIPMGTSGRPEGVMIFGTSPDQFTRKQKLLESMASFARLAAGTMESFRSLHQHGEGNGADVKHQFEQRARKVIHEAMNPLGVIKSYLSILSEKLGDGSGVQQELLILKEEILRVERIVRRLNDLPEQALPVETVNINNLIDGMLVLYGESLFDTCGIAIEKQLAEDLPAIRGDRDSLKQILLNIWKNSSEAMQDGGSFQISTKSINNGIDKGWVEIRLSDSGPGIPSDVKAQLFQPLPQGRRPANSGIGLSIVASLVELLGGKITCESSPDKGTAFTIRLPQAKKEMT